ncbi:MAG: hypothetical protein QM715_05440 [Nibricoccus sp.]
MIRTIAFSIITFAIGVFIGRIWQKPTPTSVIQTEQLPKPMSQVQVPETTSKQSPAINSSSFSDLPTIERLQKLSQALSWLKNNGGYYADIPVFGDRGINPTFIQLFGLSNSEQKILEEAIEGARRHSIEMRTRAAKITEASKGDVLVVEIPTQPEIGGQIYDTLLGSFRSVLGTDRFRYFNFFAGEPFERALDSYGALRNKFEITRMISSNGTVYFSYKKYHGGPGAELNNWHGGTLDPDGFAQFFPEIAPLIPPAFKIKPVR